MAHQITATTPTAEDHLQRAHDLLRAIQDGAQVPAHAATVALAHANLAAALVAQQAEPTTGVADAGVDADQRLAVV